MRNNLWVVETVGGPFHHATAELPTLNPQQVRVRIAASGVNPLDTKIRSGQAAHAKQPLPAVLGLEMAGTVYEVGADLTSFVPGDEVFGLVGGVGGLQGTFAEYLDVDPDLLAKKPQTLTMAEAAAVPLNFITAWEGLVDRAKVHAGQKVLIHGGAGGVGHLAIQVAKAFGAEVFSTVSPAKTSIVEALGAIPIDYTQLTPEQYVQAHTDGLGFDVIYDTLGKSTLDASFDSVKRYTGHVLSSLGWGSHSLAPLSFRGATYSGVFTLYPLLSGQARAHHGEILTQAANLADSNHLKPYLNAKRFSSEDLSHAFSTVEAGALGKVVVEIA